MADKAVNVQSERLHRLVAEIFRAVGFSDDHARTEADVLVWANLRGVDSHGIFRVPNYVRAVRAGDINPRPNLRVVSTVGATCTVEGDRAAGPVAMLFAADLAVEVAREHAIGLVLLRNTTHTGPLGYYARAVAERGMAGIVMSASRPIMAYYGTRVPAASTNPIAIAVPRADGPPLSFDMSTAAIAWGRLAQARQLGDTLPEGVALDRSGRPTTDPAAAAMPLPLAGPKGAGLSLMIECLTGLLAGMPLIAPALAPEHGPANARQHGLAIAIDIAAFIDVDEFAAQAAELARAVKAQPVADGFDEILMPGERGDRALERGLARGIPLAEDQWRALVEVAETLGVEVA